MPSLFESIKIPKDRIAVLIGKNGITKRELEKLAEIQIEIDSGTGEVSIEPKGKGQEKYLSAINIVKAIGRGFSPKNALVLLDPDIFLEIIDLKEFGQTTKKLITKKGRVIGREGKIREQIEETTETKISVAGKTIAIIGSLEGIATAKKAVEMLLQGARHVTIFKFLREAEGKGESFEL